MRAYGWRRSNLESRLGHSLRRGVKTPALWDVLRKINVQYPAFLSCFWLLASGYRLSAIGYRLSAIGYRLSTIDYRLSTIDYRLSTIGFRRVVCVLVRVRATESGGRRGASVAKQIRTG